MALVAWLWLASPFGLIGLISRDRELLAVVSAHHRRCRVIGVGGATIMLLGVTVVPGTLGWMMFLIGTPLAGLIVWGLGDEGEDGGGGPPPNGPPIDWGEFERSFRSYARRRGDGSPRPRVSSTR